MAKPRPARIRYDGIPWKPQGEAPTKVRIRRLIACGRHGSELTLGVCEMEPGEHWYGPAEETCFRNRGDLTLTWDEGEIHFGSGDAVYLAPGWHNRLRNIGAEAAFFVCNMYPSQE